MIKNKITLLLILVLIITTFITGCTTTGSTQTTQSIPTMDKIDVEDLKNKAVLVVSEDEKLPLVEQTLIKLSQENDIDIAKIEYGDNLESFIRSQELLQKNIGQLQGIDQKLQTPKKKNATEEQFNSIVTEVYENIDSAIEKKINNQDYAIEKENIQSKVEISDEELESYLKDRIKIKQLIITNTINKDDLPLLLVFGEYETARITAFPTEKEKLDWLLITKGILNISNKEELKEVKQLADESKEFIVNFGSSTCPYCYNTSPLVDEIAKEYGLTSKYVDINSIANAKIFDEFIEIGYIEEDINSTPTIVYFKDGKEKSRIEGQQTRAQIRQFIDENK